MKYNIGHDKEIYAVYFVVWYDLHISQYPAQILNLFAKKLKFGSHVLVGHSYCYSIRQITASYLKRREGKIKKVER